MAIPERSLTPGGDELHFATNHLGHFALATGLADALRASGDVRIVSVSSSASLRSPVLFDDLTFAFHRLRPVAAYGQSKDRQRPVRRRGRPAVGPRRHPHDALMPGGIATNLQGHVDPEALAEARRQAGASSDLKTVAQGAATSVLAAACPLLQGIGGRYLEDCQEAQTISPHETTATAGTASPPTPSTLKTPIDSGRRLSDESPHSSRLLPCRPGR